MAKRNALGKGLGALLENSDTDITSGKVHRSPNSIAMIPVSQIVANPFQPRETFEEEALEELAESIRIHGVIQPITVRKAGFESYELISGERRTRASILAGLKEIPAYIRLANDQEMLEMALIENIQREDLNAVEVALSYKRLLEECGLKQEELGERVGKKRSTVNNYLRLLRLPDEIQLGLQQNLLSMGHARALVNIEDEDIKMGIYQQIINQGLSVRKTEELVKKIQEKVDAAPDETEAENDDTPFFDFSEFLPHRKTLADKLESKVEYRSGKGDKGSIVIHFKDKEHLRDILSKLD